MRRAAKDLDGAERGPGPLLPTGPPPLLLVLAAGVFLSAVASAAGPFASNAGARSAYSGSHAAGFEEAASDVHPTFLIRNARIVDGTGAPAFRGAVRIHGDRISSVGDLTARPGERVVDARGLVLSPGFVDTHSHADRDLLERPGAEAAVSQGITTVVVGADGGHRFPLEAWFDSLRSGGVAVNVASYAGHGTLRREVMGEDFRRPATADEVAAMERLLEQEMDAGALGLSSGLEYDPGIYASTGEVVALARAAAAGDGGYATHLRSEDRALGDAVDEAIRIGREAGIPVHLSHLKLAMRSLWGEADHLLARLEEARAAGVEVTADVYPYTYWQSTMTVLFPEREFTEDAARFALRELVAPEDFRIAEFAPEPDLEGKTLAEVAEMRGEDPARTYLALIEEARTHRKARAEGQVGEARADVPRATEDGAGPVESIIARSMHPDDVARLLSWRWSNVATDGALAGAHPRGYGAFPRAFRILVRERGLLSLEEAVHHLTERAALAAGIRGTADGARPVRGVIRPLAYADLVLFDPETLADRATPDEPHRTAAGIERVWVSGREVWADGRVTGARPGRVIRWPRM